MRPINQMPEEPSPTSGRAGTTPQRAVIRAKDIMTTSVVWVGPSTTVRQIAALMSEKHISALPVMENRKIVGIVSEGDLIRREELGTATVLPGRAMRGGNADHAKSHGLYAKDVMTPHVITVSEDAPLAEIAEIMQSEDIKRVPVTQDTRLVGVVSRSDIVKALARRPRPAVDPTDPNAPPSAHEPTDADDDIIRFKVIETLMGIRGASPWLTTVDVSDGLVELSGAIEDENALEPSRAAIQRVPHVIAVKDHRATLQPYVG